MNKKIFNGFLLWWQHHFRWIISIIALLSVLAVLLWYWLIPSEVFYINKAEELRKQDKIEEAIICYQIALDRNLHNPQIYHNLAHLLYLQILPQLSGIGWRKSIDDDILPSIRPPQPLTSALDTSHFLPLYEAIEYLDKVLSESPILETYLLLGGIYLELHKLDRAFYYYQEAMSFADYAKDPRLLNDIAIALCYANNTEAAFQQFMLLENEIKSANNNVFWRFNLALYYEKNGDLDKAYQTWKDYIKLEKNPLWQEEAKKHLLKN